MPARFSRALSCVIASCAEATRLVTSATSPVTSWACWDADTGWPNEVDSLPSTPG